MESLTHFCFDHVWSLVPQMFNCGSKVNFLGSCKGRGEESAMSGEERGGRNGGGEGEDSPMSGKRRENEGEKGKMSR